MRFSQTIRVTWCTALLVTAWSVTAAQDAKPATGELGSARSAYSHRPLGESPYPASDVIVGIDFDLTTRKTLAQGSDIWPITWADDGHQYAAFGDGAGFGVTSAREQNGPARVSMGVSRIEGDRTSYRGVNVWGGKNAENPAQFTGKGTGILCVGGVLYMWVAGPDSFCVPQTCLAVSRDYSRTWHLADWKWTMQDRLFAGNFLNFGKDYQHARDDYVYAYFTRIDNPPPPDQPRNWIHEAPGRVDLARVPKSAMLDRTAYEWFAGLSDSSGAAWTSEMMKRQPAFEDASGIKVVSVSYQPSLRRYLLVYNPQDNRGHFGLFEAPQPWGPWRTVAYRHNDPLFMPPEPNQRVSIFHFAPKWWSADGRDFTLVFNTGDDAWNTVRGRLMLPGD